MKLIFFIWSLFIFLACSTNEKNIYDSENKKKAIELNNKGIELASNLNADSIEKAIELFNQATQLDPDYYLAYWNKYVYQNQLGKKKDALETLTKLEDLKPNNADLKVTAGIFLELNGDSLSARQKFLVAEELYFKTLDTVELNSNTYYSILTNKAVNLKYLGQNDEANKLLIKVKNETNEESLKEMTTYFISLSRKELLKSFISVY